MTSIRITTNDFLVNINLVTPSSQKNAVKALGARWDAGKKWWYIVDIADLATFVHWMPNMAAATQRFLTEPPQATKSQFSLPTPDNVPAKSVGNVADCGCDAIPWEDCIPTTKV